MPLSPRTLRPSTSFTPRSIPGLALWLDASDSATLFQDAAATTPATAASDPVGYWGDKSGNGRHVTQSTAASRPTISATTLNGRRQLGFVSQHLRGPSTTWAGSVSIYWVGKTGQASNGAIVFGDGTVDQTDSFHAGWLNTQGVGAYGNGWGAGNAPRAESPSAWRNADIVAGVTLSSTESVARVNGATTNTTAALTGSLSQSAAAQFYIGRETNNTWNNISGTLAELLIYQPALNASQRLRVERHLAAKYGITLAPQVSNADAQDWVNRVYANGGTVSASTASAVNTFCDSITNASLRDRFYRLNLFCGTGLNACLVPLYRGPSFGGTQYGNATDTNNGPFVSGDYAETGASGGLTGNGTKWLNTGLTPAALPDISTGHLSAYAMTGFGGTTTYAILSSLGPAYAENYSIEANRTSAGSLYGAWGKGGTFPSLATAAQGAGNGHVLVSRTSSTALSAYKGGSLLRTDSTSVTPASTTAPWYVFGHAPNSATGTALNAAVARLGGYSIGASMTDSQAAAFYDAMQAFQAAMTRQI